MRFSMGITDNGWFNLLSGSGLDEVNFWQPSGRPSFNAAMAEQGMPFLFKLKVPHNHIAGGGVFITYRGLPLALAWEVFEWKCGVATLDELRGRLARLSSGDQVTPTTEIGCTVLANPFLFAQAHWIPLGDSFQRQTVVGKFFDSDSDGAAIWQQISARLAAMRYMVAADRLIAIGAAEPNEKFGTPVLTRLVSASPLSAFS